VFVGAGRADPIAPPAQAERLVELLRRAGADVTLHWEPGGHSVTKREIEEAQRWIARSRQVVWSHHSARDSPQLLPHGRRARPAH
jgi:predicted esterase